MKFPRLPRPSQYIDKSAVAGNKPSKVFVGALAEYLEQIKKEGPPPQFLKPLSLSVERAKEHSVSIESCHCQLLAVANTSLAEAAASKPYLLNELVNQIIVDSINIGAAYGFHEGMTVALEDGMSSAMSQFAPLIQRGARAAAGTAKGGMKAAERFKGNKAIVARLVADAFDSEVRPKKEDIISAAMDKFSGLDLEKPSWDVVSKWVTAEAKKQGFAFKAGRPRKPPASSK